MVHAESSGLEFDGGVVLGIETSCDETAAALVGHGTEILANVVASQAELHARWGGVVPELASRQHVEAIVPVVASALDEAGLGWRDVAAVAVTAGPGLIGALMVGISYAKSVALARSLPLIGVNHVMAHVYASFVSGSAPQFPFLALIVSGGHTDLVYFLDHGQSEVIGATRDDAAGEAFDKVARILGLGYPGGPAVDRLAREGDPFAITWPSPRVRDDMGRYDFSFSGLKTAVLYHANRECQRGNDVRAADIAASFQETVASALASAAVEAALESRLPSIVLAGGVAANSTLRRRLSEAAAAEGIAVWIPPVRLCTDNAAMVASAGYFDLLRGRRDGLNLTGYSRT